MAAAAPAAEVDIRLEVDDDELFLAELWVFLYTYTREGQELRQIMSVDGYDLGPYMENEAYWDWVMAGDDWIVPFQWQGGYRPVADGIDWVTLFQRENVGVVDSGDEEEGDESDLDDNPNKRRRIFFKPSQII